MTIDDAKQLRKLRDRARRTLPAAGLRTLKKAIRQMGSQSAVARKIRVPQSRISAIIHGRERVGLETYIRLCDTVAD